MATLLSSLSYAGTLSTLALIAHLHRAGIARRYPAFAIWLWAQIIQSAATSWCSPTTWLYARIWAYSDWLVLVAQAAMLIEILWHIRSYFLEDARSIWMWIGFVAVITGAAAAWTAQAELPAVRWDKPLVVQLTLVAHRVLTAWFAGAALVTFASLQWTARFRDNLRVHVAVACGRWTSEAVAMLALNLSSSMLARGLTSAACAVVAIASCCAWIYALERGGDAELVPDTSAGYDDARLASREATVLAWATLRRAVTVKRGA